MARERATPMAASASPDPYTAQLLLRQALERSGIASCLVGPDGSFVWVNDAMCSLFGRSADELVRSTWQELTHSADLTTDQALVDGVLAGQRDSYRLLKRYLRPDGSVVWGDLTASAIRDPSGAVRVFLSQVVDATDNVERTERLRLISENAADFITMSTPEGLLNWVSPSVESVLGWSAGDLVGRRFADLVHPDDRLAGAPVEVTGEEGAAVFATRVLCKDGSYRHLSLHTVVVPSTSDSGNARVDAWRDVETEARALASAMRSSALLMADLDAEMDGRVILTAVRDDTGAIVDFEYVAANPAACRSVGVSREELVGQRLNELYPAEALTGRFDLYVRVTETGEPEIWESRPMTNADGEVTSYLDARIVRVLDGVSFAWRDVSQRVGAERQLAASEERYRLLAENTADVVILIKDGRIDWISPSVEVEFGAPVRDWIGSAARGCVEAQDVPILREVLEAVLSGEHRRFRVRAVAPNGQRHWVEAHARPYVDAEGEVTGFIAAFRVIDDLIEVESELDRRARFDELTGLLNRSEMLRRICEVTTHAPRLGSRTAVLFCDVDRFKDINDEHGHAAGDEVLRAIGARICEVVREVDYAARIGGDEILVLLPGVNSLEDATAVARKVRERTSLPVTVAGGVSVIPQLSIGVTLMRAGETADQLVERADDAMYLAKKAGRNRIVAID
jgi:diguanylate cyclase (GGDEF)-like protein/PAS domain S-box-containing protein